MGLSRQRQDSSGPRLEVRLPSPSCRAKLADPRRCHILYRLTNELVRTAIAAGADILTVHGRTRHQSSSGHPVNLDSLAFAVECAKGDIPCMANGDVFTLADAEETRRRCGVRGVMSARGLLANPVSRICSSWFYSMRHEILTALYACARLSSRDTTKRRCQPSRCASPAALLPFSTCSPTSHAQEFTRISTACGLIYPLFHRHVSYMLESHLPKKRERTYFNSLTSHAAVFDFLEEEMGLDLRSGKDTGESGVRRVG